MSSAIDPTKPVDGIAASKADLRANLAAAKSEIETLQLQAAVLDAANAGTSITVNNSAFAGHMVYRLRCTASSAVTVTLANDVPAGRAVEVVQYGSGLITAQAGSGATLVRPSVALPSTTSQYETMVFEVDTNSGTNAVWRLVGRP
jgi:hypothetical protein